MIPAGEEERGGACTRNVSVVERSDQRTLPHRPSVGVGKYLALYCRRTHNNKNNAPARSRSWTHEA